MRCDVLVAAELLRTHAERESVDVRERSRDPRFLRSSAGLLPCCLLQLLLADPARLERLGATVEDVQLLSSLLEARDVPIMQVLLGSLPPVLAEQLELGPRLVGVPALRAMAAAALQQHLDSSLHALSRKLGAQHMEDSTMAPSPLETPPLNYAGDAVSEQTASTTTCPASADCPPVERSTSGMDLSSVACVSDCINDSAAPSLLSDAMLDPDTWEHLQLVCKDSARLDSAKDMRQRGSNLTVHPKAAKHCGSADELPDGGCQICLEQPLQLQIASCHHAMCVKCASLICRVQHAQPPCCPFCRANVSGFLLAALET